MPNPMSNMLRRITGRTVAHGVGGARNRVVEVEHPNWRTEQVEATAARSRADADLWDIKPLVTSGHPRSEDGDYLAGTFIQR